MSLSQKTINIRIYGYPGSGTTSLENALNNRTYTRPNNRRGYILATQTERGVAAEDVALVLFDTSNVENIRPAVHSAQETVRFVFVVLTKIDLIPRDYCKKHLTHMRNEVAIRNELDVDSISVSAMTGEGIHTLMESIVNAVDPVPLHQPLSPRRLMESLRELSYDVIAACFALQRNSFAASKRNPRNFDPDSTRQLDFDPTWADNLLRRLNCGDFFSHVSTSLVNGSVIYKSSTESEFSNTEFALQNTNIPIPRIHGSKSSRLVSDYVDGKMLIECWDQLNALMKFRIACTLRLYVKEIRSIRRSVPGTVDASCIQGHLFWLKRYPHQRSQEKLRRYCEWIVYCAWEEAVHVARLNGEPNPPFPSSDFDWTLVFTHGDLNGSNIILDKHRCLWLIDWEMAGFYPRSVESASMTLAISEKYNDITDMSSWRNYKDFICGRISDKETKFWECFNSHIYRYPDLEFRQSPSV